MKLSRYNSTIRLSDEVLLHYNALRDSFLLARPTDIPFLEQSPEEQKKLIEGGFLVDDDLDEIEVLRQRYLEIIDREDECLITINPTLDCNFSCWYCYEAKHGKAYMSASVLESVLLFLEKQATRFRHLHVSFFGGEPLLCFDSVITPILDKLATLPCSYSTSYTTNAGMLTGRMIERMRVGNTLHLQITVDGGREYHDRTRYFRNGRGSYDLILANIHKLLEAELPVTLRINYTQDNITSVSEIAEELLSTFETALRSRLRISLHQVWQTSGTDLYKESCAAIKRFSEVGFDASSPLLNNVYSPCYADKTHSLVINFDGNVYKCTAVDFLNAPREGYLSAEGEVHWERDSRTRWHDCRFRNKPCNNCRIQPLCNGGCSKKALDFAGQDYCSLGFDESVKDRNILERFSLYLQIQQTH